jgi:hypothetical protein
MGDISTLWPAKKITAQKKKRMKHYIPQRNSLGSCGTSTNKRTGSEEVCFKLPEDGADPRHGRHPDIQILVLQQLQHLHTVNGTGDKTSAEASSITTIVYCKLVLDPKLSDARSHCRIH